MQNNNAKLITGLAISVGALLLANLANAAAELFILVDCELAMLALIAIPLLFFAVVLTPKQRIFPILLYAIALAVSMNTRIYYILFITAVPALIFVWTLKRQRPFFESVAACSLSIAVCIVIAVGVICLIIQRNPYTALSEYLRNYLTSDNQIVGGVLKTLTYDPYSLNLESLMKIVSAPLSAAEIDSLLTGLEDTLRLWFPNAVITWSLGLGFWSYFLVGRIAKTKGVKTGNIPNLSNLRLPPGAKYGIIAAALIAVIFSAIDAQQYYALIFSTISIFSYILAIQGLSAICFMSDMNPKSGRALKGVAITIYILAPMVLSGVGLFDVIMNFRRFSAKKSL